MNSFSREKNFVGKDQIVVATDEGKFVISLEENGNLYIGLNGNLNDLEDKWFTITDESGELFESFEFLHRTIQTLKSVTDKLYRGDKSGRKKERLPLSGEQIVWKSDDFTDDNEASSLGIFKVDDSTIRLRFRRSKSKTCCNSYFVAIAPYSIRYGAYSRTFTELYDELSIDRSQRRRAARAAILNQNK